ncbi:TonB-dependent copper receptor [Acerihabitans sp. TG2]|nr:TonB-dependent copper receptor [Acerihabitans sp. TG2]MEA9389115.1 TonB-dependent copper receptor [Acerihabitans sp. TG2]
MSGYTSRPLHKRYSHRLRGFMPVFTLVAANCAVAQTQHQWLQNDRPMPHDADVITVTSPVSSPLTITTATKTPRQPVPASDGSDYLKTIPGFSQIRNGGTNGDPVFRGMFGSRLKILAGGAEMQGSCPSRMDAPTSYISPESYDLLTLVKGPQTVLWGPGASAGTLRFERIHPHFDAAGIQAEGSLLGGSNARRDETLGASLGNEQGYLQLLGNKSRASDYQDGTGRRVPSRWDKWNGDLAVGWTPDNTTWMELSMGRGNGEASYVGRGMDGSQFKRESLGAKFEKSEISEVLDKIEAQVYYSYTNHIMDNTTLRKVPTNVAAGKRVGCCKARQRAASAARSSNLDRRTTGARVMGTWLWPDFRLQSGLDAQTNTHRGHQKEGWQKDAWFQQYGVFNELTWSRDQHERIIGGARLDQSLAEKYALSATDRRSATLPAGFIRYERQLAFLPVMFYTGLGYTERFPDYWEMFAPNDGPRRGEAAFATLQSEKTTQIDVGVQYHGQPFDAWLSGYAGRINDYILVKYDPKNAYRRQVTNVDAMILGGEMGLGYHFTQHWKVDASMAYSWGSNLSDSRPLPQTPPLDARFGLTYERQQWSSSALWRVVSRQQRVAMDEGNVVGRDFATSAGFGVISANVGYKINKAIKVSGGIDNILNKTYSEHLNLAGNSNFGYSADMPINEPGRTLWMKLNMKF